MRVAVALTDYPGASIHFQSHEEDQDMASVLVSRHLLDSVNYLRLVAESLVSVQYKTT